MAKVAREPDVPPREAGRLGGADSFSKVARALVVPEHGARIVQLEAGRVDCSFETFIDLLQDGHMGAQVLSPLDLSARSVKLPALPSVRECWLLTLWISPT